jgi:LPP20 lipoprotein
MKHTLFTLTAVSLVLMLALAGCGKNVKKIDNERLEEEYEHAPDWVLAEYSQEMLSAVGSAHIGKGGIQFARTEALSNARGELARQVSVKVRGLVNTFAQQTGIGDDQTLDAFSKQVSKLVTDETLAGSREKDTWISPSSDIYVLAVLEPAAVQESVRRQVLSGYQQDSARWQEFKAKNGNEELDAEIDKAFPDGK